jgi:hypothetical protein
MTTTEESAHLETTMDTWLTSELPERTIWPTPRTPARVTDMPKG